MAIFEHDGVRIAYDDHGAGFPILLIAPGGMRSAASFWESTPWNPIEHLADRYRLIAMDQRNAGRSTGPITGEDGWHTFTADQLALIDHLGIERFHVMGMCIGGPYAFGLIEAAPDRVASAVHFQPIGLDDNREAFYDMFNSWANDLRADHPEMTDADWRAFCERMYGGDDVLFNTSAATVAACQTPTLVLLGNDLYHPASTSRLIAETAPNATLIENWRDGSDLDSARQAVADFLAQHTPALT